jgi:hypothetical protein
MSACEGSWPGLLYDKWSEIGAGDRGVASHSMMECVAPTGLEKIVAECPNAYALG